MRKVSALEGSHVIALPDVVVTIGIERKIGLAFIFQYGRKPGIVTPVGLDGDGALRPPHAEEIIHRIGFSPWVPARPRSSRRGWSDAARKDCARSNFALHRPRRSGIPPAI